MSYIRGITVILFLFLFCGHSAFAISISADKAILIEKKTGEVVYEKNAYEKSGMASTTKIMTAILAIECGGLEDIVTVSAAAAYEEGSSMYLKAGERIKLIDLVYGLMLQSGNDSATAIAEHIAGDKKKFAKMMTDKALAIGAKNTSFENPHGLDGDNHYTTAYDLAMITRYALSNKKIAEIVGTKSKAIEREGIGRQVLTNHNKMLSLYDGANGVKTGFTKKVGRCLVTSAKRDNVEMIAVTLNASNDWEDHKNMLNLGFSLYESKCVIEKGEIITDIAVKRGIFDCITLYAREDVFVSVKKDSNKQSEIKIDIPEHIKAPVYPDSTYGRASVFMGGTLVGETELVSGEFVAREKNRTIIENFTEILTNWLMLFADKDII